MGLAQADEVIAVFLSCGDEHVALATEKGRAMLFHVDEIPPKALRSEASTPLKLASGDSILGFVLTVQETSGSHRMDEPGRELIVRETSYRPVKRGSKGSVVIQVGSLSRCEWPLVLLQPHVEEDEVDAELEEADHEHELYRE